MNGHQVFLHVDMSGLSGKSKDCFRRDKEAECLKEKALEVA